MSKSTSAGRTTTLGSPKSTGYEPRTDLGNQEHDDEIPNSDVNIKQEMKNISQREDAHTSNSMEPPTSNYIRYSGPNGLFGDTSIPATFPAMPELLGATAHQYADWKVKALNYFTSNGLHEIVTMKPSESITYACDVDGNQRPQAQIRALWIRLNSKAYGVVRSAVESIVGTTYFEETEEMENQLAQINLPKASLKDIDTRFNYGCTYYLWESVRQKLEQFTPHDIAHLVTRYMNLRYMAKADPSECKKYFDNCVRELKLAGIKMQDKLHLAVWYKAIPAELDSLRQALGAKPDLKWRDIYDALVSQYSSKKAARNNERATETAQAAVDDPEWKKKKDAIRLKQLNNNHSNKPKADSKSKKHCVFCSMDYHDIDACHLYKKAQQSASSHTQARRSSNSEEGSSSGEHSAPCIEEDFAAAFMYIPETDEEINMGQDVFENVPTHFIFDSGATTHVTPNKSLLTNLNHVPVMTMSTAISGQRSVINKRGQVRLNDKWTLRDVAYVPKASYNLISEGRLCDAGYEIYKNKDFIHIRKDDKVILRGVRSNRLWVYTVNGNNIKPIDPRVVNTIVPTHAKQASNPSNSKDKAGEKNQSSAQPQRSIPKKNGTSKHPAPGGASSSSSS